MVAFSFVGFLIFDWTQPGAEAVLFASILLTPITLATVYFYWRGRNWARWLVLMMAVMMLLMLVVLPGMRLPEQVLVIIEAAFGLWLLYWLNARHVSAYFRASSAPAGLSRVIVMALLASMGAVTGVMALGALLTVLAPTERPVFDDEISLRHRHRLSALHPEAERIVGLYSTGLISVEEGGCFFAEWRLVAFSDGALQREATYDDVADIELFPDRSFLGSSELVITAADGSMVHCTLPGASFNPNDPSRFHDRLVEAWRARRQPAASAGPPASFGLLNLLIEAESKRIAQGMHVDLT